MWKALPTWITNCKKNKKILKTTFFGFGKKVTVNVSESLLAKSLCSMHSQPGTEREAKHISVVLEVKTLFLELLHETKQLVGNVMKLRREKEIVGILWEIWIIHEYYAATSIDGKIGNKILNPNCFQLFHPSMNNDEEFSTRIATFRWQRLIEWGVEHR